MTAYYNEFDPFAAQWLRELIKKKLIAQGEVDERDIREIKPAELIGFTQCHFFAGIGVWSYSLRRAGWPDDKPVWTGSCPCQPFSAAGRGQGVTDERHLWPHWFHLIKQAKQSDIPILGEQVASKGGRAWFDLVQADMEGMGHSTGAVDICAAGFGAPHIRQRLYWLSARMGHSIRERLEGHPRDGDDTARRALASGSVASTGDIGRVANCNTDRCAPRRGDSGGEGSQRPREARVDVERHSGIDGMGHAQGNDERRSRECAARAEYAQQQGRRPGTAGGLADPTSASRAQHEREQRGGEEKGPQHTSECAGADIKCGGPGPTNGFWRDADWLRCRDDKWRPVEPGTFPLVDGAAARVGRLRGYGNAINAEQAAHFIQAVMEVI